MRKNENYIFEKAVNEPTLCRYNFNNYESTYLNLAEVLNVLVYLFQTVSAQQY